MDINYYVAHPKGLYDDVTYKDDYEVNLSLPISDAKIHYTTDGSEPNKTSPVYNQPFTMPIGTIIKAKTHMPSGRTSRTVTGTSKATELKPAVSEPKNLNPGLKVDIFEG